MATAIFKGITVTPQDIERAINEFDQRFPTDTNAYDSWLDKDTYKWALLHKSKLYPHKYILSLATGIDTPDFVASDAKRVFDKIGFHVVRKPK